MYGHENPFLHVPTLPLVNLDRSEIANEDSEAIKRPLGEAILLK